MRALLLALSVIGCGDPPPPADAGTDAPLVCTAPASPSRLVVTADLTARSLSLLGLERVLDPGCTGADALVGTIDLSEHAPGPIELEITPDGRRAVVAVGPGFFEDAGAGLLGSPDLAGPGALLIVDLIDRAVVAEIALAHVPMGIAISPDGARAYVAEYGTNASRGREVAIVDLAARTLIEEVEIGSRPEQVVLDEDGTLGAVTVDEGTHVFRTADVAGSLSPLLETGIDPSDLAFVPGTSRLVISNSMSGSVSIVDVADPAAPVIVETPRTVGIPYPVTWIPGTTDVLVGGSIRQTLVRVSVADPIDTEPPIPLAGGLFVLQAAVTSDGAHALVPHAIGRTLAVVDLEARTSHAISWLAEGETGPIYVAIQP